MKTIKKTLSNKAASFLAIVLSVFFAVTVAQAASTISTNIQTDGTLLVSGASTFYSTLTVPTINATSTTATSTFAGGVTFATGGGNAGIGTLTPGAKLDVKGNIKLSDTTGGGSRIDTYYGGLYLGKVANDASYGLEVGTNINGSGAGGTRLFSYDAMALSFTKNTVDPNSPIYENKFIFLDNSNHDGLLGINMLAPVTNLQVNGNVAIGFSTTSIVAVTNNAPVNGLLVGGHYASYQATTPTPSVTGSGYSSASMASGSTDTKGTITATVGAAAGTLVVTFQAAYRTGLAPVCIVTPNTATAQVDVGKMYATYSTTALTLNFVASPTGGSESWSYICIQ